MKFDFFSRKQIHERQRDLKKIDSIKLSTRDARLFFCIFRVYFILFMSSSVLIWRKFSNHQKIFSLESNSNRREKKDWKIIIQSNFQREMLDSFLAYLEYISFFSCRVLCWFDENSVIIENFFPLNQILIVEKKKIEKLSLDQTFNARCSIFFLHI